MEVEHLELVSHSGLLQQVEAFHHLAGGQAELGQLATRLGPPAGPLGVQLDAQAEPGPGRRPLLF